MCELVMMRRSVRPTCDSGVVWSGMKRMLEMADWKSNSLMLKSGLTLMVVVVEVSGVMVLAFFGSRRWYCSLVHVTRRSGCLEQAVEMNRAISSDRKR